MSLAVPVSMMQFWAFTALALVLFAFLIRAASQRKRESGGTSDRRSQTGILLQSVGIALVGFGPTKPTLAALSVAGLLGTGAVVLLMSGSIGLFAMSASALGQNWSLVDHQLVRSGPYAYVRHPIYLGMLFFLLGLAAALGHWLQLIVAVPTFLTGTAIRTRLEDGLLEQRFGGAFRDYRRATPALIPRIF